MANNSEFSYFKNQIRIKIRQLQEEGDIVWDNILRHQEVCTNIIADQVVTNDKFKDYHHLFLQGSSPDNALDTFRFNEIDHEAKYLSEMLDHYETRAQEALQTVQGLIQNYQANLHYLQEIKNFARNSTQMSQLESIDLESFQWVDETLFPNVDELNEEWNETNLFQRISLCVEEMEELVANYADYDNPSPGEISEGSVSGSPECPYL